MKHLIYIIVFLCCSAITLQAGNSTTTDFDILSSPIQDKPKYQITSGNQSIYINNLEQGVYVLVFDASGRNIYKKTIHSGSASVTIRNKGIGISA